MMRLFLALAVTIRILLPVPAMAQEDTGGTSICQMASGAGAQQTHQETSGTTVGERCRRAGEILRQMLPPHVAESMESGMPVSSFGGDMARLAYENSYVQLWSRPGLSLKERSIVTISMLIALGNERELAMHINSGLRNGITPRELEEIIYHSTAYAGFPRASDALAIAREVLAQESKTE